jgi:hypothetical protein
MRKRGKNMNKKGSEMTIGTIIVIVLALLVLVILIFGFSMGWSNLWENIKQFFMPTQSNLQTVVRACEAACASNGRYDYCVAKRDVKFEKDSTLPGVTDGKAKLSCKDLENDIYNSGLACPSITCAASSVKNCEELYTKAFEGKDAKKGAWMTNAECSDKFIKRTDADIANRPTGKDVCCTPKAKCSEYSGGRLILKAASCATQEVEQTDVDLTQGPYPTGGDKDKVKCCVKSPPQAA